MNIGLSVGACLSFLSEHYNHPVEDLYNTYRTLQENELDNPLSVSESITAAAQEVYNSENWLFEFDLNCLVEAKKPPTRKANVNISPTKGARKQRSRIATLDGSVNHLSINDDGSDIDLSEESDDGSSSKVSDNDSDSKSLQKDNGDNLLDEVENATKFGLGEDDADVLLLGDTNKKIATALDSILLADTATSNITNPSIESTKSTFKPFVKGEGGNPFTSLDAVAKAVGTPTPMLKRLKKIQNGEVNGKHNLLTPTQEGIELLLTENDVDKLIEKTKSLKSRTHVAIDKEDKYKGTGNCGDDISKKATTVAITNYSVSDDKGKGRGERHAGGLVHGMINLANGCIIFLFRFFIRWLLREALGEEEFKKHHKEATVEDEMVAIDAWPTGFDNVKGTVTGYNEVTTEIASDYSLERGYLFCINYVWMLIQLKVFWLLNSGYVMSLMSFSAHARKHWFNKKTVGPTNLMKDWGDGLHPQAWMMFVVITASQTKKDDINKGLSGFFRHTRVYQESIPYEDNFETNMTNDYGYHCLTPEQIALMKAIMAAFKLHRDRLYLAARLSRAGWKPDDMTDAKALAILKEEVGRDGYDQDTFFDSLEEKLKRAKAGLTKWAKDQLAAMGIKGVRDEDALSFVMSERMRELWKKGENPLQLWALTKCKELGYDDISAQDAMSFYMSDLWKKGENPLQLWYKRECQRLEYYNADGSEPSAEEAKRVYEENEGFKYHLQKIQELAADGTTNWRNDVFYFGETKENKEYKTTRDYIEGTLVTLALHHPNDWRINDTFIKTLKLDQWHSVRNGLSGSRVQSRVKGVEEAEKKDTKATVVTEVPSSGGKKLNPKERIELKKKQKKQQQKKR